MFLYITHISEERLNTKFFRTQTSILENFCKNHWEPVCCRKLNIGSLAKIVVDFLFYQSNFSCQYFYSKYVFGMNLVQIIFSCVDASATDIQTSSNKIKSLGLEDHKINISN